MNDKIIITVDDLEFTDCSECATFVTAGFAQITTRVTPVSFSLEIDPEYSWERKDIKELRAYLKAILRDTKA